MFFLSVDGLSYRNFYAREVILILVIQIAVYIWKWSTKLVLVEYSKSGSMLVGLNYGLLYSNLKDWSTMKIVSGMKMVNSRAK